MDQIRIQTLRNNLLRLRDEIRIANGCGNGNGSIESVNTEGCYDSGDQGSDHQERFVRTVIGNNEARQLAMIEGAISRLDQDIYGFCFDCGYPIPENRLMALPFAVRCKKCQEQREAEKR